MKISDTALDLLANTVTGSNKKSFHRGGAQLKQLFDQFGFHDDVVMTSRLEYTKARLQELNGTKKLKKVIEAVVDPRKFLYLGEKYLEGTVAYLNTFLVFATCSSLKASDSSNTLIASLFSLENLSFILTYYYFIS